MKNRKQVKIPIQGYRKDDEYFPENMRDLYFDIDGGVDIRPSFNVNNPISDVSKCSAAILIKKFNTNKLWFNASDLYFNGTSIHTYNNGATNCSAVEIFGNMYFAPSWNAPSTMAVITPLGAWSETTATYDGANKIKAGLVVEHRGILFVARLTEGATTYYHRIRWSNYGNPQDFDPSGDGSYDSFEDIGDDSDHIVNMVSLGNELIIFKQRSVWVASGIASDVVAPDYIRQLTNEYGLASPDGATKYKDGIIFLSKSGFVFTDGRTFRTVEDDMWRWSRTTATFIDANWLFCRLVWSEAYRTLFFYDYITWGLCVKTNKEWNRWPSLQKPFIYGDEVILTAGSTVGQVKLNKIKAAQRHDQIGTATSSVATISPVYVTQWTDLGLPSVKKLPRSLYINNANRDDTNGYGYTIKQYHDLDDENEAHTTEQLLNGGAAKLYGECEKIRLEIGCIQPTSVSTTLDNAYFGFDDITLGIKPTGGK